MKFGAGRRLRKFFNGDITDEMIWHEIVHEKQLNNIHQLKTLIPEAAREMVQLERRMELLSLGLIDLTPEVAAELANYQGELLLLNCIKNLTPETAKAIAQFKGYRLGFNGMRRISLETLKELSQFKGALLLDLVEEIEIDKSNRTEAVILFKNVKSGKLSLNGLKNPSLQLLKVLVHVKGELELNKIAELTSVEATVLAFHQGKGLKLRGLTSLSTPVARSFLKYKGYIDVSKARYVDEGVYKLLLPLKEDHFQLHPGVRKRLKALQLKRSEILRKKREAIRLKKQQQEEELRKAQQEDMKLLEEFEEFGFEMQEVATEQAAIPEQFQEPAEPEISEAKEEPPIDEREETEEDRKREAQLNFEIIAKKNALTALLRKGPDTLTEEEKQEVENLRKEINYLKDEIRKCLDLMVEERELGAVVFNSSDDLAKYLRESGEEDDENDALARIDDFDLFGDIAGADDDIDLFGDSDDDDDIDLFGDSDEVDDEIEVVEIKQNGSAGKGGSITDTPGFVDPFAARVDAAQPIDPFASQPDALEILKGQPPKPPEEKIDIARRMLDDNLPIPTIAKYTGLSEDEIEALKA